MENKLELRKRIAKEIIATESTYCQNLTAIISINGNPKKEFLNPIRCDGTILKKNQIDIIFSNIEDLYNIHLPLLAEIEPFAKNWVDSHSLSSSYLRLVPYFRMYKDYCINFYRGLLILDKLANNAKLISLNADKKEDLRTILSHPIQRFLRYRVLFTQLQNYTPSDHKDYQLTSDILLKLMEVSDALNGIIQDSENDRKLITIQQSHLGRAPQIVISNRKFIKEGVLVKICRKELKKRCFFLFNDGLIYSAINEFVPTVTTKETYLFNRFIKLSSLGVSNLDDSNGLSNAFQIFSDKKSFTVFAETKELKTEWMTAIQSAIQADSNNINSGSDDYIAPVWVPDKLVKNCMLCDGKFTSINRRHHCRKCGKLVCNSCSQKKFKLQNKTAQRVCDICFKQLSSGEESNENSPIVQDGVLPMSMMAESLAQKATLKFKEKQHKDRLIKASSRAGVQSALADMKNTQRERKSAPIGRFKNNNSPQRANPSHLSEMQHMQNNLENFNFESDEDISEEYNSDYDEEKEFV